MNARWRLLEGHHLSNMQNPPNEEGDNLQIPFASVAAVARLTWQEMDKGEQKVWTRRDATTGIQD